jgi:ABC-type branched-subunit amino acid transport system ATPase component
MTVLAVDDVRKSFGGVRAVDGVTFALGEGDVVALIGPNGAGKSTLFNVIDGQLAADAGQVRYLGQPVDRLPTAVRARLGVGRTFQVAQAFASMTALQNAQVALAALRSPLSAGAPLWARDVDEARALLAQVGLAARADAAAAALAYGDLKRLELALALAAAPRLLLMDEPTAGMAPRERTALMRLVVELAGARRMAVLFTEHSMDVVFGFARRVLVMSAGRLVADDQPDAVRTDPEVRRIYLGEAA